MKDVNSLTNDLASLCTGHKGRVILEGEANGAQPGSLILQGGQIKPLLGVLVQPLAPPHKLGIEVVVIVGEQAVVLIRSSCKIHTGTAASRPPMSHVIGIQ